MRKSKIISYVLFLIVTGCIEPFTPKTIIDTSHILIVEGSINSSDVQVKLTRAMPLDTRQGMRPPNELSANVRIEDSEGGSYPLTEVGSGNYITSGSFPADRTYRLAIQTQDGAAYTSDYVEIINTPAIDSVSWRPVGDVISIEANTHDFTQPDSYFKWTFEETWEYTANLGSEYEWHPGGIVTQREWTNQVYKCWKTLQSTSIMVGTTRQLNENIVRNYRVNAIERGSLKVRYRYSLLLKQRSISQQEYEFWNELEQTTENVGGLFDPMPAQVKGNLICTTDASRPVVGYFSGGNVTEKRMFLEWDELPDHFKFLPPLGICERDSVAIPDLPTTPGPLYIWASYGERLPEGYIISTYECTDCRAQGGVNKQPLFWEN